MGGQGDGTKHRRTSVATIGLFVAVVLVGVAALFLDLGEIWQTVEGIDVALLAVALAASAASFAGLSVAWAYVARLLHIDAGWRPLLAVGFISAALNNIVSAGGVAGHTARVALLSDRGVAKGDTLAASTFHAYVTNAVLLGLLPVGLLLVVLFEGLPPGAGIPLGIVAGLALAFIAVSTWIVFHGRLRRALLTRLGRVLSRVVPRGNVQKGLNDFEATMQRATGLAERQPGRLFGAAAIDAVDWLLTALTLWICFHAIGIELPLGVLLTGTVVGIAVGFASAIPAGLVVMEASMTGVFALLGVPVEAAIVAALVFRLVYHVLPFLVAMAVYGRMLRVPPTSLLRDRRLLHDRQGDDEAPPG